LSNLNDLLILDLADLYEEAVYECGENAVEKLFSASEIDELLGMVKELADYRHREALFAEAISLQARDWFATKEA
jgi:hypothetical protein